LRRTCTLMSEYSQEHRKAGTSSFYIGWDPLMKREETDNLQDRMEDRTMAKVLVGVYGKSPGGRGRPHGFMFVKWMPCCMLESVRAHGRHMPSQYPTTSYTVPLDVEENHPTVSSQKKSTTHLPLAAAQKTWLR
jgi:hypothetical protein